MDIDPHPVGIRRPPSPEGEGYIPPLCHNLAAVGLLVMLQLLRRSRYVAAKRVWRPSVEVFVTVSQAFSDLPKVFVHRLWGACLGRWASESVSLRNFWVVRTVSSPRAPKSKSRAPATWWLPNISAHARPLSTGALLALALAGCAQPPSPGKTRSSEYFPEGTYGKASQKVIADGEEVPRGGGQYLVGRPYTIAGKTYYPREVDGRFAQQGMASWYGDAFHGRRTANGEIYDKMGISAAHPTMPLPSYARVTNTRNGRSIIVRVNDRGPYHAGRVMDVSAKVADALDFKRFGTAQVKVEYLGKAQLAGSDDSKLLASLRTDGAPATLDGLPGGRPVMVADRPSPNAPFQTAQAEAVSPLVAMRPAPMPTHAPLPPSRPFDLGTIPGAGEPIAASRPRTAALYYAAPSKPDLSALEDRRGPFGALLAKTR